MVLSLQRSFAQLCKGLGIVHHHIISWQHQSQWAGRMDDQGALGLHPVWLDEGAHILMDKLIWPSALVPVMYNSEPDDGHCMPILLATGHVKHY